MEKKYDVIIVGTGVAGLNAALHLPADKKVLVICKGTPDKSDSYLAQGGICRLQGEEDYVLEIAFVILFALKPTAISRRAASVGFKAKRITKAISRTLCARVTERTTPPRSSA